MSQWLDGLVNNKQLPAERRAKYKLARQLGASRAWALRMRDWHWPKIYRAFGLPAQNRREVGW